MSLEEDINITNEDYLRMDEAVIYKKPTPVTIVKVDYPRREKAKIVEAYFKEDTSTLRLRNVNPGRPSLSAVSTLIR